MDPASQSDSHSALRLLNETVIQCVRCPRLVAHREEIGRIQRRAYRGEQYWSRPVTGFGDVQARLLIVGLAPGAHGANRTGRMFTGDRSGEFLYRALAETGFANRPESLRRDDGLELTDAYITASARCVPPDNKPAREEIAACRSYLVRELEILSRVQIVVALGGIALDAYLAVLQTQGKIRSRASYPFAHGRHYLPTNDGPAVLACYHPSQQNTSTKRLTAAMLRDLFLEARRLLDDSASHSYPAVVGGAGGLR